MSKFKNDWDWRDLSDPIPNEIMDKFEIKDSPFKKPKKDELGPENKEACELMEAQGSLLEYDKKTETETEDGEYNNTEGVGKDVYGKYAFAEMEHKGKKYYVHNLHRDYDDFKFLVLAIYWNDVEKKMAQQLTFPNLIDL